MLRRLHNLVAKIARAGTRGGVVALVLLGLAPAAEASRSERLTVNDRIARIRAAAREQTQVVTTPADEVTGEIQVAQWYNWGNWGNWNNWNNWYNWPNWGNWGNWGNF
jgi:hypothetical protein